MHTLVIPVPFSLLPLLASVLRDRQMLQICPALANSSLSRKSTSRPIRHCYPNHQHRNGPTTEPNLPPQSYEPYPAESCTQDQTLLEPSVGKTVASTTYGTCTTDHTTDGNICGQFVIPSPAPAPSPSFPPTIRTSQKRQTPHILQASKQSSGKAK